VVLLVSARTGAPLPLGMNRFRRTASSLDLLGEK
jgi:hypothetical protein